MEKETPRESAELIVEFTEKFMSLALQKKEIDDDIKSLKDEYKDLGLAIALTGKAINRVKKELNMNDADRFEEEQIAEIIMSNSSLMDKFGRLIAKK